MSILRDQVAVVTGCGRYKGLGRGIALALAAAGAHVAVTDIEMVGTRNATEWGDDDRDAEWRGLASLVDELEEGGHRSLPVLGDVGQREDAERMIQEVIDHYGRVDILVNNAAAPQGPDRGWTWEIPEDAFDEVMRVNAKGVFLMSAPVIKHLLGREARGRIINVASALGRRAGAKRAAYSASKFAVIGLTQTMAQELAPHSITVNAVCPGLMDTARQSNRRRPSEGGENATGVPVGRIGSPADVGRAVVFLADPAADFITGESLNVSGGQVLW